MSDNRYKKVGIVVGARPQFIKIALLIWEIKKYATPVLIHTGQHYDYELSQSFFDQANIPSPDYNLSIGSGNHGFQTGEMLKGLEEIFVREAMDLVIVVGDTNSTLAGALAATKLHIKIAHIEAGLRNFDKKKPEEVNRIITDHISDIFFAPTQNGVNNLNNEGIFNNIHIVGDISNDLLLNCLPKAQESSTILKELDIKPKEYYTLTIHKSKNTDSKKNLSAILKTVAQLKTKIVFPIHPRTKNKITEYGLDHYLNKDHILTTKPLSYFDMITLMNNSGKIITDSGGIQKEAYALKVPCITMRKTEWIETLEYGWNIEVDIHDETSFLD